MKRRLITTVLFLGLSTEAHSASLFEKDIDTIVKNYTIIGDFNMKPEIRDNSKEIFWRYPVKLPRVNFPFVFPDLESEQGRAEFPRTDGGGRQYQHLNLGRQYFLSQDFENARKTWLGAKARYGKSYKYHRRADYFIASSFFKLGQQALEKHRQDYENVEVREKFVNASTFFSWSYSVKKDIPDPLLDRLAPRYFYNLAAIYFRYERWGGAFGTVQDGLEFLRFTGRTEYRSQLRRMQAEMYIRNRDYLNAAQELDIALQQDADHQEAGEIFARLADIYFDLNNFELAEEMYALAIRVDKEQKTMKPWHYILRGESLFWLGKFDQSQKMMNYGLALASSLDVVGYLSNELQALASIRIADSYLALGHTDKARLAYFQHYDQFRNHETSRVARLREACLELPYYEGNNIKHSRNLLVELKKDAALLPPVAQELIWTCELASFTKHDRNPELVERVRQFYERYPRSDFLASVLEPLREVQAKKIDNYWSAGDQHGALDFFEKTRNILFENIDERLRRKLYSAYTDAFQSAKAMEFVTSAPNRTDEDIIRLATVISEYKSDDPKIHDKNMKLAASLSNKTWNAPLNDGNRLLVDRIISSENGPLHLNWIYRLGESWVEQDFSVTCNILYPALQRLAPKASKQPTYQKKVLLFVDSYLEDLFRYETNCAYSVLEFELNLLRENGKLLGNRYLKREFIPINKVTGNLFYSVAEINNSQNNSFYAEEIWKYIVRNANDDIPEKRYSRLRLSKQRNETERLWD